MFYDWTELVMKVKGAVTPFSKSNPKMLAAFRALNEAQSGPGTLEPKVRELIALAVAVTTRCDGCIASHASAAFAAGATEAEVSEALGCAIALNAGAAYVYSLRALEAYGQFSAKG
ncbi:carboxymuconolactone decarboxylase family protein [Caballeronia sp. dw_19]|uniref:carboxymuconolactone decarboxylase family protein n=1 Tax=Caballeronia sp. dw_19 TaxID=2719791 RepID=UPI001BD43B3C|nr:carboxymuconolactone decarboxylase family protein [Caballeronia sp. dw_19]